MTIIRHRMYQCCRLCIELILYRFICDDVIPYGVGALQGLTVSIMEHGSDGLRHLVGIDIDRKAIIALSVYISELGIKSLLHCPGISVINPELHVTVFIVHTLNLRKIQEEVDPDLSGKQQ